MICLSNQALEASNDAILVFNSSGIIEVANEVLNELLGYPARVNEIKGKKLDSILPENEILPQNNAQASIANNSEDVIIKKKKTFAKLKNGDVIPILISICKDIQNTEVLRYCAFIKDLSVEREIKRYDLRNDSVMEEEKSKYSGYKFSEVRKSQELVHEILDAAFDAIFSINEEGIILMVNKIACEQFGWNREEFLGSNIKMIIDEKHAGKHDMYLSNYLKTKEKRLIGTVRELKARRKDGSSFPVMLGLSEIETESSFIFTAFVRDLSKQKQDELEIQRKQKITSEIIDASFDAMFSIDDKGNILMVNKVACNKFGWTKEEFIGQNIKMIMANNHATNHDEYLKRYMETKIKRLIGTQRELKAKRKDGSLFPVMLGLSEIQLETDGNCISIFAAFVRDLSSEKEHEEELLKKQRLTESIINASFDSMFLIDEKGIIQMVNKAALEQFGWERNEMLQQNISMIMDKRHGEHHDQYLANFKKTGIKKMIGKKRELVAVRKDKSEFPIELGLAETGVEGMDERFFCGFIKDLSRQKKDEQEILREQKLMHDILDNSFDAMFSIDEKGTILMVNKAACMKFGWTRQEFIGSNIKMIMGAEHSTNHDDYLRRYQTTKEKRMIGTQREVKGKRKDGTMFPLILGLSEIQTGDSVIFAAFVRDITGEKQKMEMEIEKASAEALLLNMLPENIADRLKDDPSHIADHFSNTTILFADIVGFTALSSKLTPIQLVRLLNDLFSRFDDLLDIFSLNKVKTIGDCYMVTSMPSSNHVGESCLAVCNFALEMICELHDFNLHNPDYNLNLRIGINTGPVVAGIVGRKRFLYDLWGDAVNVASRMESTGIPGKIQVTNTVVNFAKHAFNFERRGMISVKGKGELEAFFLIGNKDSETEDIHLKLQAQRNLSARNRVKSKNEFKLQMKQKLVKSIQESMRNLRKRPF